jgi:hypothetical protein
MGWTSRTHGGKRNSYRILVGKPEEKRPVGRPKGMWKDNISRVMGRTNSLLSFDMIPTAHKKN